MLGAVLSTAYTAAAESVTDIPTRPGRTVRALVTKPAGKPIGSIILLAGGHGRLDIDKGGKIGWGEGNQVVRTRAAYARAGWLVAVPDAAQDIKNTRGYRWSAAHAQDIGGIVRFLRKQAAPVHLVGTSRAALSVINAANRLSGEERPDTLVVTSGMLVHIDDQQPSAERQGGGLGRITQPTLIVYHEKDGCHYTPARSAQRAKAMMTRATQVDVRILKGGAAGSGHPCNANSHHGFKGQDGEVVRLISDWLKVVKP